MVRKLNPLAGGWGKRSFDNTDQRVFEANATRALALVPWVGDAWRDDIARRILERALGRRALPPAIQTAMRAAVSDIIRIETAQLQLPDTTPDDPLKAVAYRARLRALLTFKENSARLLERWIDELSGILRAIADAVPQSALHAPAASMLTVPLFDLIDKPAQLVTSLVDGMMKFAADDPHAVRPGSVLARLCQEKLLAVSNITAEAASKAPHRLVPPHKSDLHGADLLDAYLPEPLHVVLTAPVPFVIPRRVWTEHAAIFAKTGHGKSQSLRGILAKFLQEKDPPALFIIDSLGALIKGIDQLEIFNTRLKGRLALIDATDTVLPALNLFGLQSDDLIFYLFRSLDQSFTTRQSTMISYIMELCRHIDGATILTLLQICESKDNPYPDVIQQLSPYAQSFFQDQFYARKPDQFVQATKSQLAQRIHALARMGKLTTCFSARENKFDPLWSMQNKMITIINTDARPEHLGGLGAASSILGRFILAQCLEAARARPEHERDLALIIVDEAKHYLDDQAALIFSDARQFGLGLCIATQFPHQLPEGVRKEINTNTSIKMMGPTEFAVASQYARDMFTTPEAIMRMKSFDRSHAEWMTYVANVTDHAIKLDVPFGAIEKMPRMTHAEHDALRAANRERYGITDDGPLTPRTVATMTRRVIDLATPAARDFGKIETVTILNLALPALLDTGAQVSAVIATACRECGTPDKPRLAFTFAMAGATHSFERPITGRREISGAHGATKTCPVVPLTVTLGDYVALEQFAVTVEDKPPVQAILLGETFFAAMPFPVRISPVDTMLIQQRIQR